jgi:hypothetical protein
MAIPRAGRARSAVRVFLPKADHVVRGVVSAKSACDGAAPGRLTAFPPPGRLKSPQNCHRVFRISQGVQFRYFGAAGKFLKETCLEFTSTKNNAGRSGQMDREPVEQTPTPPPSSEVKKPYQAPVLVRWGTLLELTEAVGNRGGRDGGKKKGRKRTRW